MWFDGLILKGEKVLLVPYTKNLVPKYFEWMQDPYVREMTASDQLTLEEEYTNQISWKEDENSKKYY